MEGRTDGETLFHKTLPAEAGGPIKFKFCDMKLAALKVDQDQIDES